MIEEIREIGPIYWISAVEEIIQEDWTNQLRRPQWKNDINNHFSVSSVQRGGGTRDDTG